VILWFGLHPIYASVSPFQPTEQQRSGVKPIALEKIIKVAIWAFLKFFLFLLFLRHFV